FPAIESAYGARVREADLPALQGVVAGRAAGAVDSEVTRQTRACRDGNAGHGKTIVIVGAGGWGIACHLFDAGSDRGGKAGGVDLQFADAGFPYIAVSAGADAEVDQR